MRTLPLLLAAALLAAGASPAIAQHTHPAERVIEFPDVAGYLTLTCDLHMHSVFSDGNVWPTIRVQEAIRDGLDCISTTEHIEYQPHRDDIPHPDRNRSFEIATRAAGESGLIVLNGSEITRSMPPGHSNAVFVQDANRLLVDGARDAFEEAARQEAFVFWNHPNWTSQRKDGIARLTDMHRELIADGLLHGIEVVNETTYSEEALQIALENDLTIIGTSDVHGLIDWEYDVPAGGHRPVTLVFAREKTVEGIREGLVARRTAVWHRNMLIGREEHLKPLLEASLTVAGARWVGDTSILRVTLRNTSDAPYMLLNESSYTFHEFGDLVVVEPHSDRDVLVKALERVESLELAFDVVNTVTAPGARARMTLAVRVEE